MPKCFTDPFLITRTRHVTNAATVATVKSISAIDLFMVFPHAENPPQILAKTCVIAVKNCLYRHVFQFREWQVADGAILYVRNVFPDCLIDFLQTRCPPGEVRLCGNMELDCLILDRLGLHPVVLRDAQTARQPFEEPDRGNLENAQAHCEHALPDVVGCREPDYRQSDAYHNAGAGERQEPREEIVTQRGEHAVMHRGRYADINCCDGRGYHPWVQHWFFTSLWSLGQVGIRVAEVCAGMRYALLNLSA